MWAKCDRAVDFADAQILGAAASVSDCAGFFVPDASLRPNTIGSAWTRGCGPPARLAEFERPPLQDQPQRFQIGFEDAADCTSSSACAVSTTSFEVSP